MSDGLLGAADHGLRVPLKPQPPHLQARHPVTTPGRNASATRLATVAASCAQIIAPRRLAPAERPSRVFIPLPGERRKNPAGCGLHLLKALEGEGGLQVPSGNAAGCPAVRPFRPQVVLQDHSEVGAQCMLAAHGLAPGFTALLCAPPRTSASAASTEVAHSGRCRGSSFSHVACRSNAADAESFTTERRLVERAPAGCPARARRGAEAGSRRRTPCSCPRR